MKFDELDAKMRALETAHDTLLPVDSFLVARLDGRSFTRLTKELLELERPFDERFRDAMLATAEHVMNAGFRISYAYTESDELSLLFAAGEDGFSRKSRKLTSILAGEASACFSLQFGRAAAFDCRLIELPTSALLVDYFRWRQEDAARNALNAYCYWNLRARAHSASEAAARISGTSLEEKKQLLLAQGVDFDAVPRWQTLGVGLYWEKYQKAGTDPRTGSPTLAARKRLVKDLHLPRGESYREYLEARLREAERSAP